MQDEGEYRSTATTGLPNRTVNRPEAENAVITVPSRLALGAPDPQPGSTDGLRVIGWVEDAGAA